MSVDAASFGKEIFLGRVRLDLLDLPPDTGLRLDDDSEAFLARLREFCLTEVDSRKIERDDRVPDEVITGLKDLGAFCVKIPREYGGLGLPGACYHRALMLVGSVHSALSELLAAHQAIGVPQPVLLFGTDEQKREFLPRCARDISAFLLTEPDIGNDPFRMRTTAVPDGEGYVLNGVKLWATNGVLADLMAVLAMVPESGPAPGGMTAFVVDADTPGITVERRNAFLGLRGVENGVIRFHDVVVPARNRIGGEGDGLDIALAAQDTGRLSMPAVCAAAAKWSLKIAREWSAVRVQWGRPIGEHEAVAAKISFIAATAFALEAIVEVSGRHADAGTRDTRVEAELAKLFATEKACQVADELVQIRGGRGYETAESAAARGERGVPAEQLLRDLRIGRIFDGSSEVMRAFIGHDAANALPTGGTAHPPTTHAGPLAEHLTYADATARWLAAHLAATTPETGQLHLGRLVDIASELYAMAATHVYATRCAGPRALDLADTFCHQARHRIDTLFTHLDTNTDAQDRDLAASILAGNHTWLEEGVLDPSIEGPWIAEHPPGPTRLPNLRRIIRP
ncbi:acyl-CoA dehydrogenase family protein [Actinokineospora sp. 24-640]